MTASPVVTETFRPAHVDVGDGRRMVLRPIQPADREPLAAMFAGLSGESLHRRFLGPKAPLTNAELRYLTDVDHVTHSAVVAVDEATGSIVGEGRYAPWGDCTRKADLALTVADDLQGRRLGTMLALAIVRLARRNGVALLTASTLSENVRARAILRRLGFRPVDRSAGVVELELPLAPLPC